MKKKKSTSLIALLMSLVFVTSAFAGCGDEIENPPAEATTTAATEATTTEATVNPNLWDCAVCGSSGIASNFCPNCGTSKEGPAEETTKATEATTTPAETTKATTTTAATTKATTKATTTAPATSVATPVTTTPAVTAAPVVSGNVGKHAYNQLTTDEKKVYDAIVAGLNAHETTIEIPVKMSRDNVRKVVRIVYYHEPSVAFAGFEANSSGTEVDIEYDFTATQTKNMFSQLNGAMASIQAAFPANATEFDKVKAIHDYIIKKSSYSTTSIYSGYAYGALVAGQAQCEGYAKGFAYACNYFGIENVRVTGNKYNNLSHAWNKVKINGSWYNVDTMWDEVDSASANSMVRYTFFCLPDSDMQISHIVQSAVSLPAATSWSANYFRVYGLYASSAAEATTMMQKAMISCAKAKREYVQIRCSSKAVYDEAYRNICTNGGYAQIVATSNATSGCYKATARSFGDSSFQTTDRYIIELRVSY